MQNVILPFLLSMMLGRTIDLRSYNIRGTNVYDDAEYDERPAANPMVTKYTVFQEDSFPYTYFGIPPDIAFKIKSNIMLSLSGNLGLEGLLKDTSWKYNSAILTFTTLFRTVDRSLKEDAVPLDDWREMVPRDQTHYVRSLFYGGWAQVVFRFKCDLASDVFFVRQVLNEHLGRVGQLTNETDGQLEAAMAEIKTNHNIRGKVTLSTYLYSTMPFRGTFSTPNDILEAQERLRRRVGKTGIPLMMDLRPLHELDPNYPEVKNHDDVFNDVEKMDDMLDDLQLTKSGMMKWILETNTKFNKDQGSRMNNLLNHVKDCIRSFSRLAAQISFFREGNQDLMESSFKKYNDGLQKGISSYYMAFRRLKEEIDAQCEGKFLDKIRGLLRVYDEEMVVKGQTKDLDSCKDACKADDKCRSIGFAPIMSELDIQTGLYYKKTNQCWLYYRSTSTAPVHNPTGTYGDLGVYDRVCY